MPIGMPMPKIDILKNIFRICFKFWIFSLQSNSNNRGVAQLASASGLGPEGPVFESQYPDTKEKQSSDFQVVAFLFSGFWGIMHQRKMHQRKIHVDIVSAAGGHQKYLPTAALRNDSVDQTLPLLA